MENLSIADIVVIVLYIVGVAWIGIRAGKRIKSGKDFTNAGNGLTWLDIAGTALATLMGANMVLGKYDTIYESGMAGITSVLFSWIGQLIMILLILPIRNAGVGSFPSFLEKKFNTNTRKIAAWCVIIVSFTNCAAQFLSVGSIFNTFGILNTSQGTWVGAAIIVVFTIVSGLWGVVKTDRIQAYFLVIAIGIIYPIFVIKTAGGVQAIAEFNGADRMDMFKGIAPATMVGWAVFQIFNGGANAVTMQRICTARSKKDAYIGLIVTFVVSLIINGFLTAYPAMAINMIFPEMTSGRAFTPTFIVTYYPVILRGLMLAALLGLLLTSGDTHLLLISSTVMEDIVLPRVKDMDDKKYVRWTRLICIGVSGLIVGLALYMKSIYQIMKTGGGAYGAAVFIPFIMGLFWKKANAKAINIAMIVGFATSFCFDLFLKVPLGLDWDGCVVGGILCLLICVLGSLIFNKIDSKNQEALAEV